MCKVLVFAGTTEGRSIAEFLHEREVSAHICVATQYGEELLPGSGSLTISHERLSGEEMAALMQKEGAPLVIDATHPYAAEVTQNIRQACEETGSPYVRVLRETEDVETGSCVYVDSMEEAVCFLEGTSGNILATTGSKDAAQYTRLSHYEERVYLRVLSLPEAAQQCSDLGFRGKNLICMQGPFSKELNAAMLKQLHCRYLVTKLSGHTGGFMEKLEAARECGCTPVIIGRPLKEEGISVNACKRLLCERFSLESRAEISLVGMGMGSRENRTLEADEVLKKADLLIGARRMVEACRNEGQDIYAEYDSRKIASYIKGHPEYDRIAVVLSGDVGFYSGAKKLLEELKSIGKENVKMVCGISSAVYFMSRIGKSWDDAVLTSAHGKEANLIFLVKHHAKVFSILGTRDGISALAGKLLEYGLENVTLYTGERLSYPDERIKKGRPEDFVGYEADPLSVVLVENEAPMEFFTTHGIADEAFLRDKVPMTKEEVRTVSLSKLHLKADSICYDVGAGTGSVSIEMAERAFLGRVYALEKNPAAVELLRKNRLQFAADNLEIIEGLAPKAMEPLEAPTHAFIGGSSGNLRSIMEMLLAKNPQVRMVINCIALETVSEALACLRELPVKDTEVVQLSVSRAKEVGQYHMMMGENPIYVISCTGGK